MEVDASDYPFLQLTAAYEGEVITSVWVGQQLPGAEAPADAKASGQEIQSRWRGPFHLICTSCVHSLARKSSLTSNPLPVLPAPAKLLARRLMQTRSLLGEQMETVQHPYRTSQGPVKVR